MDVLIKSIAEHPEQTIMGLLFSGLLVWVMYQNNSREKRYQDTIERLTKSLGDMDHIKLLLDKINDKIK
ncbi:hypothetical protein [Enterococcus sp. CR-Ec1]|uniref:hypothetical protein n=1 Tax=Enterococcus sp. CR-Ec1 TaxID=2057791 RepID=UPI000C76BE9A|nr:hypothetical protein [Enterococcus sp. CR-Ec1]AUJ85483.1 hypothetical protein CXM95_08500 [Enterococcus sp. CR-Ec1]